MKYFNPRFSPVAIFGAAIYGILIACWANAAWWLVLGLVVVTSLLITIDALLCNRQVQESYEAFQVTQPPPVPPEPRSTNNFIN